VISISDFHDRKAGSVLTALASELHSHFELAICDTPYGHPLAKKREKGSNCETKTGKPPPSALPSHPMRRRIPEIDAHLTRS
jgi:hypothetical protein